MTQSARPVWSAIARSVLKAFANAFVIVGFALLAVASYQKFAENASLNSLGLVVVNGLFVCMYVARRDARLISTAPGPWLLAFAGTTLPLLMRPTASSEFAAIGNTVQLLGICLVIAALFSLRRSFGIVPANRGIRDGGLYRVIRHPLYAAELLALLGVVLANPSVWNGLLWILDCALQFFRARAEEEFLSADPRYRDYSLRVRYRLVPGLI